jgi:allantoicase
MKDGWEMARHPDRPLVVVRDTASGLQETGLSDWALLKLGMGGATLVNRIILDNRHLKGNHVESVAIDGCHVGPDETSDKRATESAAVGMGGAGTIEWFPLLRRTRLTPHAEHEYAAGGNRVARRQGRDAHARHYHP